MGLHCLQKGQMLSKVGLPFDAFDNLHVLGPLRLAPGALEPAPGHLGPQMVAFLLRFLLAEAPEPAPGHLGPQMVAFS